MKGWCAAIVVFALAVPARAEEPTISPAIELEEPVAFPPGDQSSPAVAHCGDSAVVIWVDHTGESDDTGDRIRAARIDDQGRVLDRLGIRERCARLPLLQERSGLKLRL